MLPVHIQSGTDLATAAFPVASRIIILERRGEAVAQEIGEAMKVRLGQASGGAWGPGPTYS